jgi:Flp pilus assembly protein TadG
MKTPVIRVGKMRRQPAQTMVEFALGASLFILILFATIEMALAVFAYNTLCFAAREAARYAMVHGPNSPNPATTAQIQQVAINAAASVNLSATNITVSWPADSNLPSKQDAQVQISYNYNLQIPFLSSVTLKLTSTSQMLVSQ